MVDKWKIKIPELTGEEERGVYLYLPDSYAWDSNRRYPVLYMFDGHNVFFDSDATYGKCWGMKEYLDETETQLIVAAVECNHSPDFGRLKEYAPYSFADPAYGKIVGKGKITMDWFTKTFKPEIDQNFRTLPDREHTFIAGSSMGGLMSLYAVLKYNSVFSKGAALSPSLWTAPEKLINLAKKTRLNPNTTIYMDYGEKELGNHKAMRTGFADMTAALMSRYINVESRIIPGGTHCEASWEKQIPFFLSTLLYEG